MCEHLNWEGILHTLNGHKNAEILYWLKGIRFSAPPPTIFSAASIPWLNNQISPESEVSPKNVDNPFLLLYLVKMSVVDGCFCVTELPIPDHAVHPVLSPEEGPPSGSEATESVDWQQRSH